MSQRALEILGSLRQIFDGEAMNSEPLSEESLKNGRQWRFREVFDLAAGTGSVEFAIINDTSVEIRAVTRRIEPDEELGGSVSLNPTVDSAGTPFREINNRIADPPLGDAPFPVEYGGTYSDTSGDLPIRSTGGGDPAGPGTAQSTAPAAASYRIEPGGGIHYRLTEESGNSSKVTVEFVVSTRE